MSEKNKYIMKDGIPSMDARTRLLTTLVDGRKPTEALLIEAGAYAASLSESSGTYFVLCDTAEGKRLITACDGDGVCGDFDGAVFTTDGVCAKVCPLTHENARALMAHLPWLKPEGRQGRRYSIGLGDRLGLATAGHLRLLAGKDVFPVVAQQSIRELNLTGRTYNEVVDSAMWAVFQEGWRGGYGADGDHLKNAFEIEYALAAGCSMITLDCSDHLGSKDPSAAPEAIYKDALYYVRDIYKRFIEPAGVDLEVSVDETAFTTTPEAHQYIAETLIGMGVQFESLAPRFIGEFQKGIDYIGDLAEFETCYKAHAAIADRLGYKLSIHSGSDKFAAFPVIAKYSDTFHVKTAGTNWLEALRVIAIKAPALFREIYAFAKANAGIAKAYYGIKATGESAPEAPAPDAALVDLFSDEDARQVMHITYGLILNDAKDGKRTFKDRFYKAMAENEDTYAECLAVHIGKHLQLLGL
jgi:hypothetical protein